MIKLKIYKNNLKNIIPESFINFSVKSRFIYTKTSTFIEFHNMAVRYRFKSELNFSKIDFDGAQIYAADVKSAIYQQRKLGRSENDLKVRLLAKNI